MIMDRIFNKKQIPEIMSANRGMTLVELMVVLLIIAMMTGILVTSTDRIMDRTRADETQRRGNMVVKALTSDGNNISRFIADMGRPPMLVDTEKGKQLSELWEPAPDSAYEYAYGSCTVNTWPEGDTETVFCLPCGWRGPYISVTSEEFYDGWPEGEWSLKLCEGKNFDPETTEKAWVNPLNQGSHEGKIICQIKTLGAEPNEDEGWENQEREFPMYGDFLSNTAELLVTLKIKDGGEFRAIQDADINSELRSVLVVPDAFYDETNDKYFCSVGYIPVEWTTTDETTTTDNDRSSDTVIGNANREGLGVSQVRFTNLMPGPKVLYAYGFGTVGSGTAKSSGDPIIINLKPGSNLVSLYLTHPL